MISDTDFSATFSVLIFLLTLAASITLLLLLAYGAATARSWRIYPKAALLLLLAAYAVALAGFSLVSHDRVLARGEEKYFCEIDCHIAYSIAEAPAAQSVRQATDNTRAVTIYLQTRFDENSISEGRPKDVPLTPNPRSVALFDSAGRRYLPTFPPVASAQEHPITDALIPGASYLTPMSFTLPGDAHDLRLLVMSSSGPERVMIGHEESFGHRKTYFRVE